MSSESNLPKGYEPVQVEERWYASWLDAGCFEADATSDKEGYSIVIPPPNVTGILHLGHVLNNTIQDVLARRARRGCHAREGARSAAEGAHVGRGPRRGRAGAARRHGARGGGRPSARQSDRALGHAT